MKITLTEEPTYTAKVGGVEITGMRVVSEWNGMMELTNRDGQSLIVGCDTAAGTKDSFSQLFGDIFSTGFGKNLRVITGMVIRGSPDLVMKFKVDTAKEPTSS